MSTKIPFKKDTLFKTPESYFDSFDDRLMSKIEENNNSKKTPTKKYKLSYYSGIAATIALVIGSSLYYKQHKNEKIQNEAIINYIEYNPAIALSPEFIEAFDEQDIKELEQSIPLNQQQINEYVLSSIDLEYYISD
ncbi:hypothetical protein [Myroides pelagicus]|uniref:Uncharacterized protein n=1 Tax=Myroides pelagicus TaxID=270914 RepID=A0A7K1GP70_9FLAO|nr:hypothetical protein [Myroides pelagicus]MEC4114983.1 hypothetical protein [Myroides pelagicus]MTH30692.1 hypothetical protein [Myroides pelagicus]